LKRKEVEEKRRLKEEKKQRKAEAAASKVHAPKIEDEHHTSRQSTYRPKKKDAEVPAEVKDS
jgi:hypothetical protein